MGNDKSARPRAYDSSLRRATADETRRAVLECARRLFVERGYAATTMSGIASAAGVALDTVYAAAGKKPTLFRLLIETAISGEDQAVPAEARDYVKSIRAEPDPRRKLRIYATALRHILPRLAPLFQVLSTAAPLDDELQALWREIAERRASNMRLLARDLAATGRLKEDVTVDKAADILWSMNSPEFFLLLVRQRGWTPQEFEQWLADAWISLLLKRTR